MTDATDKEKCESEIRQQHIAVTMTTDEKYALANELLQQVDANIVKTATLRKQIPVKCIQLLARRCRFQFMSAVSMSLCHYVYFMLITCLNEHCILSVYCGLVA